MPVLIAVPLAVVLWLFAAWVANDAACGAIETQSAAWAVKALEKVLLACFI